MRNFIFLILMYFTYLFLLGYGYYQCNLGEKPENVKVIYEELSLEERHYVHGSQLVDWSSTAMVIAFASVVPFIGFPGVALVELLKRLGLFRVSVEASPDWYWPLGIYISLLLPLCIPLSVAVFQFGEVHGIEWLAQYGIHLTIFLWTLFMAFYPNILVRMLS